MAGQLLAVSDLHVSHPDNRAVVERLRPRGDEDWLLVAGDVGERLADIEWALTVLARNFPRVLWAPGNHELWTPRNETPELRGEARYRHLVAMCRGLGVLTPEDPYPVWEGEGGPAVVVPMFLLYDYSFMVPGQTSSRSALHTAYEHGVVCTDEFLLHPDPYPSRAAWCAARVAETERRLAALEDGLPTVLMNHYPLVRDPTRVLHHPDFALWCGTTRTDDWHVRFRAAEMVYGHLHIPRRIHRDGVPFTEVSLGYPREWQPRGGSPYAPRRVLDPAARGSTVR